MTYIKAFTYLFLHNCINYDHIHVLTCFYKFSFYILIFFSPPTMESMVPFWREIFYIFYLLTIINGLIYANTYNHMYLYKFPFCRYFKLVDYSKKNFCISLFSLAHIWKPLADLIHWFSLFFPPELFFLFIYLFIYFWLRWVFVAVRGLSLVAVSGGYSSLWCAGFSLRWLLL